MLASLKNDYTATIMMKCRNYLGALLLWLVMTVALADPLNSPSQQPLLVDQAFPFKAWSPNPHTVVVQWDIQPSYYLYRDKLQFTASHGEVQLGPAKLPPAGEI